METAEEIVIRKLRIVFASLFFIVGSALVVYSYNPSHIDLEVVLTAIYTTAAFLMVEKQITFPGSKKVYENKLYNRLSTILFLPSAILLYYIGYKYNLALTYQSVFAGVLTSTLFGTSIALVLIIVSAVYELILGGGVEKHEPATSN